MDIGHSQSTPDSGSSFTVAVINAIIWSTVTADSAHCKECTEAFKHPVVSNRGPERLAVEHSTLQQAVGLTRSCYQPQVWECPKGVISKSPARSTWCRMFAWYTGAFLSSFNDNYHQLVY